MKNMSVGSLVLLCMAFSVLHAASTVITDANWFTVGQSSLFQYDDDYSPPVYAKDSAGNFYVTGGGLCAGGMYMNSIAKWDHQKWTMIAPGIDGSQIGALAIDSQGALYAGTTYYFGNDSFPINTVVKWNGSAWMQVGDSLRGLISTLAFDKNGVIYAGTEGVTEKSCVFKLCGKEWKIVGQMKNGYVRDLKFDKKGNLYVCGYFDTISGYVGSIAKWDGSTWSALGAGFRTSGTINPEKSYTSMIYGMQFFADDLYIYGDFDSCGSMEIHDIARWDGNNWYTVGNGTTRWLGDLIIDKGGDIYSAGNYSFLDPNSYHLTKLINNEWSVIDRNDSIAVRFLMIDNASNIYGMRGNRNFVQLTGGAWSFVCNDNGLDGSVNAFAYDSTTGDLYVAGYFTSAGNKLIKDIARWDGMSWTAVGSDVDLTVQALAIGKNGVLYAGGNYHGEGKRSIVSVWDGSSWKSIAQVTLNTSEYMITALSVDADGILYAGGIFDSIGGVAARNIAKWDGTSWCALKDGITGVAVQSLAHDKKGNLYVGGNFDKAGIVLAHNIARWDGTVWSSLGDGIQKDPVSYRVVNALVVGNDGNLYVGGDFDVAGGVEAGNIAKWNGTTWSNLGSGVNVSDTSRKSGCCINALSFDRNGNLYAGGFFNMAGSARTYGIAQWDGSQWNTLSSGSGAEGYDYGEIFALNCSNKGVLSVGGNFYYVAGKPSACFAQCNLLGPSRAISSKLANKSLHCISKISNELMKIRCNELTKVHYRIYSLSGRQIHSETELVPPGEHTLKIKIDSFSRGAYIADIRAGNASLSYRFVVK